MPSVSHGSETDHYSVADVAELTLSEIHSMERDDLIQVIVQGRIPFVDETRLDMQDMETLRRLAFLARNCCQHQSA